MTLQSRSGPLGLSFRRLSTDTVVGLMPISSLLSRGLLTCISSLLYARRWAQCLAPIVVQSTCVQQTDAFLQTLQALGALAGYSSLPRASEGMRTAHMACLWSPTGLIRSDSIKDNSSLDVASKEPSQILHLGEET